MSLRDCTFSSLYFLDLRWSLSRQHIGLSADGESPLIAAAPGHMQQGKALSALHAREPRRGAQKHAREALGLVITSDLESGTYKMLY